MNYQSVRTAIETPFQTNYGALSPAIPVFFDNFYNVLSDSVDEFIHVNIKFGLTTETALTSSHWESFFSRPPSAHTPSAAPMR